MNIKDNHITYVEFKAKDLEKIKAFYTKVGSKNLFFSVSQKNKNPFLSF